MPLSPAVLLALALAPQQPAKPTALEARVDPRVELMSVIFRLAGNPEYNMENSKSPYANDVAKHFGPFQEHAAVKAARDLRTRRGVSFDAVMSLAVHVVDVGTLAEKIPFDKKPPRLDARWQVDEARDFLEKARAFVEDTGFEDFLAEHDELYRETERRLAAMVNARPYLEWFDRFFGARANTSFHVIAGLLAGGGNYGMGTRDLDGREEITPIFGVYQFDAHGIPVFGEALVPTVVHEFCHSYTNRLVDAVADRLASPGERLFARCKDKMAAQAYGDWRAMMYESLVRACVVRYRVSADGDAAGKREIDAQVANGFQWIEGLSQKLADYEQHRDGYPSLDVYMPQVVAFFDGYAAEQDALRKH